MATGQRAGRKRQSSVPVVTGNCPVHGVVEFRIHKNGARRYRARCPDCHNETEKKRIREAS